MNSILIFCANSRYYRILFLRAQRAKKSVKTSLCAGRSFPGRGEGRSAGPESGLGTERSTGRRGEIPDRLLTERGGPVFNKGEESLLHRGGISHDNGTTGPHGAGGGQAELRLPAHSADHQRGGGRSAPPGLRWRHELF